ncbi:MAG: alpha amylase C-terminal domain-containing protein [Bacteroidales bacterium]|nr:alpha amylase C-terminal domain-containing protein [Bacteroidales bacterium]
MSKTLQIIKEDPWLEPVSNEINERYQRFIDKKKSIEADHGSLYDFASAYKTMGFHLNDDKTLLTYREWAPKADRLFLIGDFNDWEYFTHPLQKKENGIWEIKLKLSEYPKLAHKAKVKVVVQSHGRTQVKIPAYIRRVIQNEETKDYAGQLWFTGKYPWKTPLKQKHSTEALLIYETHIGMSQENAAVGTYKEFEENILPYIKETGYNTIQIMAIAEHPYYGSFGYHVSNFFAPSSRFGTPEELKSLIDTAHKMGLRVIMDIVHSHTVKNTLEGLNEFDGSDDQYFHAGERGNHELWDSKLFDYGKTEVLQFLLSNIRYWLEEYHIDGFRFDGVTSMLYHHHGIGVDFGDRDMFFSQGVEYDALTYLQLANELCHSINQDNISIAEDVSGMPGLCHTITDGGIGFDYRLGMGIPDNWIKLLKEQDDEEWQMHQLFDTLTNRNWQIKTIAYAESHDQALVGDKTLAFRMMDQDMYFNMHKDNANVIIDRGINLHNLIRFFTISLGGEAYLNFMGNEFGHPEWIDFPREGNNWSYHHARRQWSLQKNDTLKYHYLYTFEKAMLAFVKKYQILSANSCRELWVGEEENILVFERANLVFVFNFHPSQSQFNYDIQTTYTGKFSLIFNSDAPYFGGFDRLKGNNVHISASKNNIPMMPIYSPNRSVQVYERVV